MHTNIFSFVCLWYTKIKLFLYMELYSICSSTSIFGFSTIQYLIVSRDKCVFLGIDALVYLVCLLYSVICFSSVLVVS